MIFKRTMQKYNLQHCSLFEPSDLLTIDPHSPTPEPVSYDKTDGLWYTHDGVNVKDTQQRKGNAVKVIDSNSIGG